MRLSFNLISKKEYYDINLKIIIYILIEGCDYDNDELEDFVNTKISPTETISYNKAI